MNNKLHSTFLESPTCGVHAVLRNAVNLAITTSLPLSLPPCVFFPMDAWMEQLDSVKPDVYIFPHTRLQQLDAVKPDGALNEALRQVGLADVILLNKIDLVTKEQLSTIKQRVR